MENLMDVECPKEYSANSGQLQIIGGIIGLVFGIIVSVAVAIPVTNNVIASAGLNGTTKTVVEQIPVLVALVPMVLVAGFFGAMGR